eukprot:gene12046-12189_t
MSSVASSGDDDHSNDDYDNEFDDGGQDCDDQGDASEAATAVVSDPHLLPRFHIKVDWYGSACTCRFTKQPTAALLERTMSPLSGKPSTCCWTFNTALASKKAYGHLHKFLQLHFTARRCSSWDDLQTAQDAAHQELLKYSALAQE